MLLFYTLPSFRLWLCIPVYRTAAKVMLTEHIPEVLNPVQYVDEAVHEGVELLVY